MTTIELLITAMHLAVSLAAIWVMGRVSIQISGPQLKTSWACIYLAIATFWGVAQMVIAREGSIIFFPSSKAFIQDNDATRWIALISIFAQCTFYPDKDKSILWFRKK